MTHPETTPADACPQPVRSESSRLEPVVERLRLPVIVSPGTRLEVAIDARDPAGHSLGEQTVSFTNAAPAGALSAPSRSLNLAWLRLRAGDQAALSALLLAASLAVYLAVRLIGLADFPIYFFTDEAVQTLLAADLLRDGLQNYTGEWLPTYFINGGQYNLSLSVYLQALPVLLFERSVFLTRLVPMLATLLAAFAVGQSLQRIFGVPAWTGVLLLSLTPAWFLHSRTAFETALATSFFAGFLYCYLRYRHDSPRHLYPAVGCAALAFYSYSPAQAVLAVTAVLLLVSDAPYHWQQRKIGLRAAGLALLLALPYVRFQVTHPGETLRHLAILKSYWVQDLSLSAKLAQYLAQYLQGLSPLYWHLPDQDMARHILHGYGHLWRPALPLLLAGLGIALWNLRRSPYRTLLAAVLAAPAGAALVGLGVTRALFMVVPAALLTALGLHAAVEKFGGWLARTAAGLGLIRLEPLRPVLAALFFLVLAGANLAMLRDALVNGPLWFREYDLGGLQYGARQLFPAVEAYLEDHPAAKVLVSPTWANGTDVLARFFSGDPLPYQLGSITGYQDRYTPIDPEQVFVMTPAELELAAADPKFTGLQVERTLPYPDGQPGFVFARLHYSDAAPALFAAESQARRRLVHEAAVLPDFTPVQAAYSTLDMGQIQDVFDGDPFTLIRSAEANPLQLAVEFPAPRALTAVDVRVGGTPTRVIVRACPPGADSCLEQSVEVGETPHPRVVPVEFAAPVTAARVAVEVLSVRDGEPAHVHLWEVTFR